MLRKQWSKYKSYTLLVNVIAILEKFGSFKNKTSTLTICPNDLTLWYLLKSNETYVHILIDVLKFWGGLLDLLICEKGYA